MKNAMKLIALVLFLGIVPMSVSASDPLEDLTNSASGTETNSATDPISDDEKLDALNAAVKSYNTDHATMITTINDDTISILIQEGYLTGTVDDYKGFSSQGDLTNDGTILPPSDTPVTKEEIKAAVSEALSSIYQEMSDEQKRSLYASMMRMWEQDVKRYNALYASGKYVACLALAEKWLKIAQSQLGADLCEYVGVSQEQFVADLESAIATLLPLAETRATEIASNAASVVENAEKIAASATVLLFQQDLAKYYAYSASATAAVAGSPEQFSNLQAMGDLALKWMNITTKDPKAAEALKITGYNMPTDAQNTLNEIIKMQVDQIVADVNGGTLNIDVLNSFEWWGKKTPYVYDYCVKTYGETFWTAIDDYQKSVAP